LIFSAGAKGKHSNAGDENGNKKKKRGEGVPMQRLGNPKKRLGGLGGGYVRVQLEKSSSFRGRGVSGGGGGDRHPREAPLTLTRMRARKKKSVPLEKEKKMLPVTWSKKEGWPLWQEKWTSGV